MTLSVRRKIVLVVVGASLLILAFGAYVSFVTLRSATGRDARALQMHHERMRGALEQAGLADFTVASLLAQDPELARVLAARSASGSDAARRDDEPGPPKGDEPKKDEPKKDEPKKDEPKKDEPKKDEPKKDEPKKDEPKKDEPKKDDAREPGRDQAASPRPERAARVDRRAEAAALERLTQALSSSLEPELVVIVDALGAPLEGPGLSKISRASLQGSRLLQDVRAGLPVRSRVVVVDNVPYFLGAARVVIGERVLGAVLVGRKLGTFFTHFTQASNANPERQIRPSFVRGGVVLASSLPKDEWAGLVTELRREPKTKVTEGEVELPILQVGGKAYAFWDEGVSGYEGARAPEQELGRLVVVRTRSLKADDLSDQVLTLALSFGAAALVAVLVGLALALHITRPIDRYIAATQGLAEGKGDLTQRLPVQADDELGRLAKNLNRVFEQIHELAAKVQDTALHVNDSSEQIGESSRLMLDGAKTQAVKIENSTAAVTELSASIQQVAENAGEATKMAHKSGQAAENAIVRLGQIRHTVEEAASRIEALGESGKRIGSIVEVIRHISEQTTLLALNAAIEAAHAGEQGRGFAVVADEVSNLAKRVGRSAKDIEDLIATIRDQTAEAVRAMQVGTREVEEGTSLVTNTLADLKTLIGVVEDTATAVNEQAIASDEIARNMDAVRTIAREVLSASEQAVREGAELADLATLLGDSVQGFKLERGAAEPPRAGALKPGRRLLPAKGPDSTKGA
jgi:methyl-accepting chemotaxis protein